MLFTLKNNLKALFLLPVLLMTAAGLSAQDSDLSFAVQTENWAKATAELEKMTQSGGDAATLLSLGNAYLAHEKADMAKKTFEKAAAADPSGAFGMVAQGSVMLMDGNAAGADALMEKAAKKVRRKDAKVLRAIGESYMFGKKRDFAKAETRLKEAYNAASKDFDVLMSLGLLYKQMGKGGDAVLNYEFAKAARPGSNLPEYMIAKVYQQSRNIPKYEEYLQKLTKGSPNYIPAQRELGIHLYDSRKSSEAIPYFEKIVSSPQANIDDEMYLANCYFLNKEYSKVETLVPAIIAKDPSKNYLRRLLAYSLFEKNETVKAAEAMEDYFNKVSPDKIIFSDWDYRGRITEANGDTLKALEYFKEGLKLEPSRYTMWGNIAKTYYSIDNYCEAASAYSIYIDSMANNQEAQATSMDYFYMGFSLSGCTSDPDRHTKAVAAFTKVTEMNPTALTGWDYLSRSQMKLDPNISDLAAPDYAERVSNYGKAKEAMEKVAEIGSANLDKNLDKVIKAYEYLISFYYLKKDYANFYATESKLTSIDSSNARAAQLKAVVDGETGEKRD